MTARRPRWGLLLTAAFLCLGSPGGAAGAAWPAVPPLGPAERLDLAAMVLDLGDLPEELGYFEYQDFLTRADGIAAGYEGTPIAPEEVTATGLRWFYESAYRSPNGQTWVRSYVLEFGAPHQAEAGFAFFEDEARWAAAFGPESDLRDLPEDPGLGEEPREITVGVVRPPVCCDWQAADVTFRLGRLLAGVSVEANAGSDAPDRALALALARRLEERARLVLDGRSPAGTDPAIRDLVLPIAGLWPEQGTVPEGYLTVAEGLGELKPLVGFREDYRGGYARTATPAEDVGGGPPRAQQLVVTVAVVALANPLLAQTVLKLSEFLPRPAPLPLYAWAPTEAPEVPGTAAAAALAAPSRADAYQVGVVVDDLLARVWVEGTEDARAIALDLAAQQAACLEAGGPCEDVVAPPELTTSGGSA